MNTTSDDIQITLDLRSPHLDGKALGKLTQSLQSEMLDLDEVKDVKCILDPNPPEGNKALGAVLVEAIQREHSLSSDTHNELKRLQRILKLRDGDIAQIVASVNPSNEAVAVSQAETPTPHGIRILRVPAISVPVLRNSKLLIGAGIAGALTLIFLVNMLQPVQAVEPASTANPTMSLVAQTSAEVYFYNRGRDKYFLGDYKGAIADYTQAIKLNPNFSSAYMNRGVAKDSLGDYKGAISDFSEAIWHNSTWLGLDRGLYTAYYNRGNAKASLGDKGAIADYTQAIKLNPDYAEAYSQRGYTKSALGDNKGGIADSNEAIKLNPGFAEAYYSRGIR